MLFSFLVSNWVTDLPLCFALLMGVGCLLSGMEKHLTVKLLKAVLAIFGTLESAALKTQCGGFLVPACAEACAPHFRWWVHLAEALKPGCTLNLGS